MLIDVTYTSTGMDISYLHERKIYFEHFKIAEYPNMFPIWVVCDEQSALKPWINWDDKPVKLVYGKRFNLFERLHYLRSLGRTQFDKIHGFSESPILAVDFEMEIDEAFPEAEDVIDKRTGEVTIKGAQTPIVSAALTADDKHLTTTLMTIDKITQEDAVKIKQIVNQYLAEYNNGDEVKVNIIAYPNEKEMLKGYLEATRRAPIVTGWNFTNYDMPYLKNRLKKYNMDMSASSEQNTVDWLGNPTHKFIEDYMYMFREQSSWMIPNCERFGLDYISSKLVGLGKLPFPPDPNNPEKKMTLKQLRQYDLPRFLAYNVIDTALVQLIHRISNSMSAAYHLAALSYTSLKECLAPTKHSAGVLMEHFLENDPNIVVALQDKGEKRPYPGGYVKEPIRHFAENIACFDYSSLYPSIIRTHNLSPANFVRKIKPEEFEELKKSDQHTVTVSGSLYKNDKDYFYKTVESKLYDLRKAWQHASFMMVQKCELKIHEELMKRGVKLGNHI